jgi:hypothetical protein
MVRPTIVRSTTAVLCPKCCETKFVFCRFKDGAMCAECAVKCGIITSQEVSLERSAEDGEGES